MFDRNSRADQTGRTDPLGLAVTVIGLCAVGIALLIVPQDKTEPTPALLDSAISSAVAATPEATSQNLPSSAQAKSWDHVEYLPGDWDPAPGTIED